ncbi:HAD family hydrolase [Fundicoccus culcitae]|uniref:HAD family hydrolase n=1 Tax=Fundicoccus culcitae TaxID=2969821 RepID=A0ABY5P9C4_9LACT|nr:HAD family hydrolase [Fundicoccus culcitae]UUX34963.1 HAD family hydrolase [Fundicoccus culcitae]
MTLKLIMIDLDETLLRKNKTYDEERFNRISEQLIQAGVTMCIATGNSYHKVVEYVDVEHHKNMYYATDNGNYLVHGGQITRAIGITPDLLREIATFIDEFEGFYIQISLGNQSYMRKVDSAGYERIRRYNNKLEMIDSFDEIDNGHLITKIAVMSDHSLEKNKVLARILNERFEAVNAVTSGDGWIDIYTAEGGKGSAVKYLQELLGISPEASMAFGDSLNDESMMKEVLYSVAMENADHDLADSCRFQVGSNEDQAVLTTLERYIIEGNLDFMEEYRIHHI